MTCSFPYNQYVISNNSLKGPSGMESTGLL
jgi:hypothetical protein